MAEFHQIPGLIFRTRRRPDGSVRALGYYYQAPKRKGEARAPEVSLGTSDLATAIEALRALRAEARERDIPERLSVAIARAIGRKVADRAYRPKTAADARRTADAFRAYLGDPSAVAVDVGAVEDYQRHLHARLAPASVVHHMATLRGIFRTLVELGVVPANPFAAVRVRQARHTRREKFCTRAERDRLIATCAREDLRFIFFCGFHAGLRIGEIVSARAGWFHLDSAGGFLTVQSDDVFQVKSQARTVPLSLEFRAFLEGYGLREPFMLRPDRRQGRAPLRYDCRKPFGNHVRAQGLPWVTPHTMRHTFASLHAMAGRSATKVARWMGITVGVFDHHYAGLMDVDREIDL